MIDPLTLKPGDKVFIIDGYGKKLKGIFTRYEDCCNKVWGHWGQDYDKLSKDEQWSDLKSVKIDVLDIKRFNLDEHLKEL